MSAIDRELAVMRGLASCRGDEERIDEAAAEVERLRADLETVTRQRDAILQQARFWSGEAKAQKSTVDEVGAILGGVPDWGPIAAGVEKMRADLADSQAECERLSSMIDHQREEAIETERMLRVELSEKTAECERLRQCNHNQRLDITGMREECERAHGIKTSPNLCLSCGHSIDAHDRQYGCPEDGCDCETPNA